jgi:hypothetical protein
MCNVVVRCRAWRIEVTFRVEDAPPTDAIGLQSEGHTGPLMEKGYRSSYFLGEHLLPKQMGAKVPELKRKRLMCEAEKGRVTSPFTG